MVLPECGGPSRNSSLGDIDSCASVMTRLAAIRVVSREMAGKFGGRLARAERPGRSARYSASAAAHAAAAAESAVAADGDGFAARSVAASSLDGISSLDEFFESGSFPPAEELLLLEPLLEDPPSSSSSSAIVAPSPLRLLRCLDVSPYVSTKSAGMSTAGPGAKPSPDSFPRSRSSSTPMPDVIPPNTPPPPRPPSNPPIPPSFSPPAPFPAADADAFARIESSTPGARFRARAVSSPDACGTGSKSRRCPTHARCTRRSQSTSESANSASRSALDTASPTTDHSQRSPCSPAGMATVSPIATPRDTEV